MGENKVVDQNSRDRTTETTLILNWRDKIEGGKDHPPTQDTEVEVWSRS